MKTTPRFLLPVALLLAACTLDDLEIPDPLPPGEGDGDEGEDDGEGEDDDTGDGSSSSGGLDPEPDPLVPGAWVPCEGWDDDSCSPSELGCFMPTSQEVELGGHCTWICDSDADCQDLAVDGVIPQCLPYKVRTSACQLPCTADVECPEGMACRAIEVFGQPPALVCVWEIPVE